MTLTDSQLSPDTFVPPMNQARRRRQVLQRIAAAVTTVVLVLGVGWAGVTITRMCGWHNPISPTRIWRTGGECVGVSEHGDTFGNPDLEAVGGLIADQNAWVAGQHQPYVRVVLLSILTWNDRSPMKRTEVQHSVEGAYVAQWRANHEAGDHVPLIQLVLANEGSDESQWHDVVDRIVDGADGDHPVAGVIGLGVSWPATQRAAAELSRNGIPMVGGALSADQLDSRIGGLFNVSPSNADYVGALAAYVRTRADLHSAMLVADSSQDLYTTSLADDFDAAFKVAINKRPRQSFEGTAVGGTGTPALFDYTVLNICQEKPDMVLFAGRHADLTQFLVALSRRPCQDTPIRVLTGATGLSSASLSAAARASGVSMIYSTSDDASVWAEHPERSPAGFQQFFAGYALQFPGDTAGAIADGYAVMFHDAGRTLIRAVRTYAGKDTIATSVPGRRQILNRLSGLNGDASTVDGATGSLIFSLGNHGRAGAKEVPVLQTVPGGPDTVVPGPAYLTPSS